MAMWIGWMVALITAVAVGLLWHWLRREIAERGEVEQEHAALDAQLRQLRSEHDQVMKIDHLAGLGQLLVSAAPQISKPMGAARAQIDELSANWIQYRNVIAAYDEAIQHCLTPLDMLVGTETADLDPAQLQLVLRHVESSRHRVFDARAALLASSFDSEAPPRLREIAAQLDGAGKLLGGFASGARTDDLGMDDVDVHQALEAALLIAAPLMGERIRVLRRFCEAPKLRGALAPLHQMMLHLVTNACEAMPAEGLLTLETRLVDGTLEIDVADTGVGISDEALPHVFEPFFTTRPSQQHGLGLAAVHRIVKAHRGSIQVRTQPGAGTRFTVSIPLPEGSAHNVTPLFRQRESA